MSVLKAGNEALRFLLELCALAALGYWGYVTGRQPVARWGFALGIPLAVAALWGAFGAPGAPAPVSAGVRLLLEILIFGGATAALATTGHPGLAWAFGLLALGNRILMFLWGQ